MCFKHIYTIVIGRSGHCQFVTAQSTRNSLSIHKLPFCNRWKTVNFTCTITKSTKTISRYNSSIRLTIHTSTNQRIILSLRQFRTIIFYIVLVVKCQTGGITSLTDRNSSTI